MQLAVQTRFNSPACSPDLCSWSLLVAPTTSTHTHRAEKVFEQQVLPVLQDAAGMSVHTLVTAGPGAATQMAAQLDLSAVDLLLFVGGDGTVYEGLQVSSLSRAPQQLVGLGCLPGLQVYQQQRAPQPYLALPQQQARLLLVFMHCQHQLLLTTPLSHILSPHSRAC